MEPPPPPPPRRSSKPPRVVAVLAGLLERAAERGDAEGEGKGAAAHITAASAAFRGRALPGIPVRRYAERIYRYAGCSPACFVVAYVYLDRLLLARGRGDDDDGDGEEAAVAVGIDSYTVHRLLITSVLVAAKFMDDRHYSNAYFARVGGVELAEMNALELRLLFALRFRLNVHPATFARYCAALQCHADLVMADDYDPAAAPLVMPLPSSVVVSGDEGTTKAADKRAADDDAAGSAAAVHSHHHHRRAVVVQMTIMTTAQ